MDSGNIGFVLLCAAFVFVMTPGLAMFYGGLVRKKNVVNTMMTSIFYYRCRNCYVGAFRLFAFVRSLGKCFYR